jgi:SAM-dependent methyltransferase
MDNDNHEHGNDHHGHGHGHGHGHASDQSLKAMFRYLRSAPGMWRSDVNDAVVGLLAPQAGETVVDIGAGVGAGTMRAARSGASVLAIEPTSYMRRTLRFRRLFQRSRSRITVLDGAAENLPLADASADAVWAVNTMHHWIDTERGAAEICRVLRPGGRVVLVDEDFEDTDHPHFERFAKRHGDGEHHTFSMVDANQMGEMLTGAGFSEVEAVKRRLAGRPVIAVTGRT